VAKKGFIETPSLLGEYLFPRQSHRWILHEHNDVLYLVDKEKINFTVGYELTELIQEYLPKHSIGFKIMERTHPNLITIRIEWERDFKFVVNPTDPEILKYFTKAWKEAYASSFFPPKTYWQEVKDTCKALASIGTSVLKSKVF
jgi:hypothetical protein